MNQETIKKLKEVFGDTLKEIKIPLDPKIQKDVSDYIHKLEDAHRSVEYSQLVFR